MALKQLFNEEHFNKFIDLFEDDLKNNREPYYKFPKCNSYKMQLLLNLLTASHHTYIQVEIKDNETKLESLKYKMRINKICSYKLLLHCLKNYTFEYIENLDLLNHYNGNDRIVNSTYSIHNKKIPLYLSPEYREFIRPYDYNKLNSPLNRTIYDNLLHKTVKEFETYFKTIPQIINSQKKIVRWYKQQLTVRKTRLLLTSYRQLNKRKFQLPTDIICNKILKLNY